MFVIFPADELILMTYGPAIPRLAPRPTLDCLREPEIPIEIPPRSLPPPSSTAKPGTATATGATNKSTTHNKSTTPAAATNSSSRNNSSNISSAHTNKAPAAAHNFVGGAKSVYGGAETPTPVFTTAFTYDSIEPTQAATLQYASYSNSNSLPPTPTRHNSRNSRNSRNSHTSRTSLTHSAVPTPETATPKRSSVRSNRSSRSLHQDTPPRQQPLQLPTPTIPSAVSVQQQQQLLLLQQRQEQEYQQQQLLLQQQLQQQEQLLRHLQIQKQQQQQQEQQQKQQLKQNSIPTRTNSANVQMQQDATGNAHSMQNRQGGQRPTLERSTALRGTTPQRGLTPQRGATAQHSHESDQMEDYAGAPSLSAGSGGQLISARNRSPSIFLEPPSPNPTQIIYGPGWGRPMSPMNLPPEPRPKSPTPSKSSRLRPKLHLPLGRLGRSTSTDQRESNRLKEDLQLLVDNPVFNCENLRQRNFDAFFESGEPKYKLQPLTPNSAPTGSLSSGSSQYSPQIDARSMTSGSGGGGDGGLFAPSPHENKSAMNSRTRSTEQPAGQSRERRAASVSSGVGPQKGDRFFNKIFKWSKKS